MADAPIKVGIAGLGRSGWGIHGWLLGKVTDKFSVVAVFDKDPARLEEAKAKFGCATYDTFEKLLRNKNVELVVVAMPSHLHAECTIKALKKGKHVVTEKPMAANLREADRMIRTAAASGKVFTVFQNYRYEPTYRKIKEIVQSGALGRIVEIQISIHGFGRRWDWQTLKKNGGGTLRNTGPHMLDMALDLLGHVDVTPWCHMDRALTLGDAEDHVKVILQAPGKPLVDIEITSASAYKHDMWLIMGTQGGLTSNGSDVKWKYFNPAELPPRQVDEQPTPDRGYNTEPIPWKEESWLRKDYVGPTQEGFYLDLYESLCHGAPLAVKPEEVRRQMWVIEQCFKQSPVYNEKLSAAGPAPAPAAASKPADKPLPLVMLVGDSIAMGYEPHLKELLAGKFRIESLPDNGGTSANVLAHLDEWIIKKQPDIIHFNAGLHDIAVDEGKETNRVLVNEYEANLRKIVRRLKTETKARLIWATTTPVIDAWHMKEKHFGRAMADVVRYNAVALRVMKENGVEIDDLFAAVQDTGRENCLRTDGVHMQESANKLLAQAVAKSIAVGAQNA